MAYLKWRGNIRAMQEHQQALRDHPPTRRKGRKRKKQVIPRGRRGNMMNNSNLPDTLTLFFDGSCEPKNPGGWGTCGWVLMNQGEVLASDSKVCSEPGPRSTNNVAEYCALGFALNYLEKESWKGNLSIFGDSKLVVNQMTGEWVCNKEHLQKLRQRCRELLNIVAKSWSIAWVPREHNERADALSRQAYEKATGKPYPERNRK
jgi:ribonuclease HI